MEEFYEVFQDEPFRPMAGPCTLIQQQLKKMEEKNIFEKVPVGESITWYHPMAFVPKKSSDKPTDHSGTYLFKQIRETACPPNMCPT